MTRSAGWRNRLLLGATLLLGFAMMALQADPRRGFTMGDPVEYANEAWIIVHGPQPETWPTRTKRPMLMPLILACSLELQGSLFWLRLTVGLFGVATIWLTYLLATRLIDQDAGLVAAAILVTNPLWSSMSAQLFSEVPATFFFMLCLVLLSGAGSPGALFGAGCAIGATILVRYHSLVILVPVCGLVLWRFRLRQIIAFGIGLALMLALQGLHDLLVQGRLGASLMATLSVDLSGLAGIHYGEGEAWWHSGHPPGWYYLRRMHRWLTVLGPVVLLIGGWTVFRNAGRFGRLVLLGPLVFTLVVLSANAHKELRYLVIITPLAALCCGAALHAFRERAGGKTAPLLLLLLVALPLQGSYQICVQEFQRFYTGQADALRFLGRRHAGAVVATPCWSVCLPETSNALRLLDLRLSPQGRISQTLRRCDFVLVSDDLLRNSKLEKMLRLRFREVGRFPSRNETYLLYGLR